MKPILVFLVSLSVSVCIVAGSQQPGAQPQESHLRSLEFLIGDWVAEGELPGAGHFTAERTYRWILDKNFIQQTHKMKIGTAEFEVVGILGWDPQKQKMVAWGFGSDAGIATSESNPDAKELVFEGQRNLGGTSTPIRATFKKLGPDEFTELAEMKKDGAWISMFTFHFTRKLPGK
ncbi:MAG TPA: DUF1579 family protein [Candidatus Acidoferrum sp.]|nr:DUF1579 family protein [Candidatus Acidoferrum sp.]